MFVAESGLMKYNYKLIRSKRKTISISIGADNSICVRAPYGLSEDKITSFIQSKSGWIEKKVNANFANIQANSDITDYNYVLVSGDKVPLVKDKNIGFIGGAIYINKLDNLKKVYLEFFGDEFKKRFYKISELSKLNAASLKFRSYKSRWGCCDNLHNVTFNYKILMLPVDIQNYVIVHELCHTLHMNHSAAFWREVSRLCPNFKEVRSRLKNYAFITRLYP